ncbi:MAG: hypothetical protein WEB53_14315 [Akkermansiaceae bacterium]
MKLRPLLTLCAALLALSTGHATAQTSAVPGFISYQGRVVDATGANVGAGTPVNRTVIFRIWDNPSSTNTANLIYSEAQTVTVSEGEFSVLVGQGVANPTQTFGYNEADRKLADLGAALTGSASYLGVTVAAAATIALTDNEITPRQQIVSTAFALRAKVAESVDANAISSTMLANGAVGSTQLAAASVTSAKLGTNAVLTANIGDFNVTTDKIANSNVTTAKIADNAVDNTKLRDSTGLSVIGRASSTTGDPADIAAPVDGTVLRRSGTSIGFGTVGTAGIADGSVRGTDIATDTITASNIAPNAVGASELANGAVTSLKFGDGTMQSLESLRIIRGVVAGTGAITSGAGFTVTRTAVGTYTLDFTTNFTGTPTLVVPSPASGLPTKSFLAVCSLVSSDSTSASRVIVKTYFMLGYPSADTLADFGFCFTAIGPR